MSGEDLPHAIINRPHEYRIIAMRYQVGLEYEESYIDLELEREKVVRRLRFWSPLDLEIEKGFPNPTHGMQILDVRSRQMEGIGIRVSDFEASWGSIRFWALEVVDLDVGETGSKWLLP